MLSADMTCVQLRLRGTTAVPNAAQYAFTVPPNQSLQLQGRPSRGPRHVPLTMPGVWRAGVAGPQLSSTVRLPCQVTCGLMKRRYLKLALTVVMTVVLVLASYLFIDWRNSSRHLLSLEEALWTCDGAMQNFYPPTSSQSASILAGLAATGLDVETKKYRHELCLRILGPNAPADAAALWGPFDPEHRAPFIASQR